MDLTKTIVLLQDPVPTCAFRAQPLYSIEQAGLLLFLLAKLRPTQQSPVYRFSLDELTTYTNLAHSFASLMSLTMELGSRTFTTQYGRSYEQYRLFQSVTYLDKEEAVIIKFTTSILPCLHEWKARLQNAGLL